MLLNFIVNIWQNQELRALSASMTINGPAIIFEDKVLCRHMMTDYLNRRRKCAEIAMQYLLLDLTALLNREDNVGLRIANRKDQ